MSAAPDVTVILPAVPASDDLTAVWQQAFGDLPTAPALVIFEELAAEGTVSPFDPTWMVAWPEGEVAS